MKTFKKILFSIFVFTGSTAMACHQGDFTTSNKGHYKWGKNSGLFQYTVRYDHLYLNHYILRFLYSLHRESVRHHLGTGGQGTWFSP